MLKYLHTSYKKFVSAFCGAIFFSSSICLAQDFHLSQYDANSLYLNPAMTGMFDGYYRIHGHYRTQWAAVAFKPFTTTAISFDMPVKKYGVGGRIMNFRAGAGGYNVLSIAGSAAYDLVLDKAYNHHLAFGIQAEVIQKSVDMTKLTFGNQYTTGTGGGFDPNLPTGEIFQNSNFFLANFNAGMLYYYAKEGKRLNPFLGFSTHNITQPKESFFDQTNKLPIRYTIHGGTKINLNEKIQLLPKFLIMRQKNAKEFTYSLLLHYFLSGSDTYLIIGPTIRRRDATVAEFGIKTGKYICRVSYDINTSPLKSYSNSRGAFEISFTYIPQRGKPNPYPNCPRL